MSARVADPRQRVVFRTDREVQRPVADAARERGRQVADAEVDIEPGVGEQPCRPRRRLCLLELQLGVLVDAVAERDQPVGVIVDGPASGGLGVHVT